MLNSTSIVKGKRSGAYLNSACHYLELIENIQNNKNASSAHGSSNYQLLERKEYFGNKKCPLLLDYRT